MTISCVWLAEVLAEKLMQLATYLKQQWSHASFWSKCTIMEKTSSKAEAYDGQATEDTNSEKWWTYCIWSCTDFVNRKWGGVGAFPMRLAVLTCPWGEGAGSCWWWQTFRYQSDQQTALIVHVWGRYRGSTTAWPSLMWARLPHSPGQMSKV